MFARGTGAVIIWLAVLTFTFVLLTGVVLSVADIAIQHTHHPSLVEGVWQNMLRALDPAVMHEDAGWPLRIQSLLVVIFGILVLSSLIGLVASGIDRRVSELRKGRSLVLEEGHTLVLGWSEKVFPIISELVIAYRERPRSCIVLLAPHDKIDMEDEIRSRIPDPGRTRIVCRSGDPSKHADLALTSPYDSQSVIVLGSNHEDGDAQVVRTVLALMDDPRFGELRVVVDCLHPDTAESLRSVTSGRITTIASSDVIARITAQACRHTGLGTVFNEILNFDDIDIYFHQSPSLTDQRFGDLVLRYEQGTAIGVRMGATGHIQLNPADDYVLQGGDATVLLAESLHAVELRPEAAPHPATEPGTGGGHQRPTRILIAGWNPLAPRIVSELDKWVVAGSLVRVLIDESLVSPEQVVVPGLHNIELCVTTTRLSAPERLLELATEERYDRVVVLCYRSGLTSEQADARALMTLLHVRQFREAHPELSASMSVVTEVLDIRDVDLARVAGAEDLIVSERLTALMLSQLAELPDREQVFTELFDVAGSQLCMRPVSDYAQPRPGLPFGSYVDAAHRAGHLAIGYRASGPNGTGHSVNDGNCDNGGNGGGSHPCEGIVLNPAKSALVDLQPDDRIIVVVAQD
ncbi:MAG: hypothetical protein QOF30_3668 [Acidimicrobiaceae bacterium]|nr:hypothetical protein [Acidimicrobiaceae bacterium]